MVLKRHEIRESSPVEEIIGKTPSSIVRWGISIVAIVLSPLYPMSRTSVVMVG